MATKAIKAIDQLTKKDVFQARGDGELLTFGESAEYLGLTGQGALGTRLKSHADIFKGKVIRYKEHAALTDVNLVYRSALDESQAAVGQRSGRDGLKWFHIRIDEATAEMLRSRGHEVVKPTDRAKAVVAISVESNGVESDAVDAVEDVEG